MTQTQKGTHGPVASDAVGKLQTLRFGSALSREVRDYNEAVDDWWCGRRPGPAPAAPFDLLEPFREAWGYQPKKPISLRVDQWLLALVKEMAVKTQTPYQEIFRIWLEDGMRRALKDGLETTEQDH